MPCEPTSAAAVPVAALTAWQGLIGHAGLTSGRHVLVQGGAGGVGSFVVQIASAQGARVTTTALPQDRDFVTRLGADRVVDYSTGRFEDQVADVDVVFDAVGGETQARSWAVLHSYCTRTAPERHPRRHRATAGSGSGLERVVPLPPSRQARGTAPAAQVAPERKR